MQPTRTIRMDTEVLGCINHMVNAYDAYDKAPTESCIYNLMRAYLKLPWITGPQKDLLLRSGRPTYTLERMLNSVPATTTGRAKGQQCEL